MRVFALSDIHVDYEANADWVAALSRHEYRHDVLILAGDVSDSLERFARCLDEFTSRFRRVFFVPGNHDLWVLRDAKWMDSLDKFERIKEIVKACGASMHAETIADVAIVPLLGWYDYSFGLPDPELTGIWMDFRACRWPGGWGEREITDYFIGQNDIGNIEPGRFTISFSHFLPRIDVMPALIPPAKRKIYPLLGSHQLDRQIRAIGSDMHVYGHSHVNRDVTFDGVRYINNAFAYPHEERIATKALLCIYRTS